MKLEFSRQMFENKYEIKLKSVQWKTSFNMWKDRQTDRQTDMMKLIVAVLKFSKAPKKWYMYLPLGYKWLKCCKSIAVSEIYTLLAFYPA
jgi:hypothetical protein